MLTRDLDNSRVRCARSRVPETRCRRRPSPSRLGSYLGRFNIRPLRADGAGMRDLLNESQACELYDAVKELCDKWRQNSGHATDWSAEDLVVDLVEVFEGIQKELQQS